MFVQGKRPSSSSRMSIRQVVCFAHFPVLAVFGYGFGRPPLKMRTRECAFFFRVRIPPLTCRYPIKGISSLNLKMSKEEMEEKAKLAIKAGMDAGAPAEQARVRRSRCLLRDGPAPSPDTRRTSPPQHAGRGARRQDARAGVQNLGRCRQCRGD